MDARWWSVKRVTFANRVHIIVCILKDWKVTVVGIECDSATF